ncbi:MAG: ATP-grasp domain-containing protein [Verrucomicrobia bacterium]|jgi:D-alanine-D-alanine ligase|nr:ATP-grasp domain-containing protein [Verrucomicrobiota bacterium]
MKRLKVLALFDAIAPTTIDQDLSAELRTEDWRTEADVLGALRKLGHRTEYVAVFDDLELLRQKIRYFKPDVIFNLCDQFRNNRAFDQHMAGYLELCGIPFTGCGAFGLALAKHKGISKEILACNGLCVPRFVTLRFGQRIVRPPHLSFPLVVKPVNEEASLGISQSSLVETDHQFRKRVRFLRDNYGHDVIAEEYIHGRELYVSLLGDRALRVLPIREILFQEVPEGEPRIASYRAKWDADYRTKWGIGNHFARLRPALRRKVQRFSREVFRVLELDGYVRLDLRITPEEDIVFIEANPNPILARDEDFAHAARKSGLKYHELVQAILRIGLETRRG